MSRRCTVCSHEKRDGLEELLLRGWSNRRLASQFGLSETAIRRHRADHLGALAEAAAQSSRRDNLLTRLESLSADAHLIGRRAERDGDLRAALSAIRELVRIAELQARIAGELTEQPTVNILLSPQYLQVQQVLVEALAPYPQIREIVAGKLAALEAGS